jgi:hypothetical protein
VQDLCDRDGATARRVAAMLGDRDDLKELYVERTCLCMEFWLHFLAIAPESSAERLSHRAAVAALEQRIKVRDPDGEILKAFGHEGDGRLQPCHHKVFRRYDIIVSSIGAGAWRGAMPMRGTDGSGRADTVDALLAPVEAWLEGRPVAADGIDHQRFAEVQGLLGQPDPTGRFLASLLVSLLHAQALAARQRARSRAT